MTRRRLVLAALAVVALWAVWWWFADGLSPEEQRFAGMWKRSVDGGAITVTLDLAADRQWLERTVVSAGWGETVGHQWAVRDGDLVLHEDTPRWPRPLGPMLHRVGLAPSRVTSHAAVVDGARLIVTKADGTQTVWTRP